MATNRNTACGTVPTMNTAAILPTPTENLPVARELYHCPCGSRYIRKNRYHHNRSIKHQTYLQSLQADNGLGSAVASVVASSDDFSEEEERDYDDVESTIDIKRIMYSIVQKSIEDMIHVYLTDFFENLA